MGSLNKWDGTLSRNDFYSACRALVDKWKQIDPSLPQWTWIPYREIAVGSSREEEGYLSLEKVYHFDLNEDCLSVGSFSEIYEASDNATLVQKCITETHIYDFHIVYSFSYRVPVMYFRGYQCDGQPLKFGDIENDLPCSSLKILREAKWTYMTQEEHPYLHRPWFTLHPCGTSDWMKLLVGDTWKDRHISCYLPSWLSVVGQAVGLRIPLELQNKST